jgi:cytochrome c oxidase cbb3-type subunit 2
MNPRDVVPESNMPGYPWLAEATVDGELIQKKMKVLQTLGDPYSDEEIAAAADAVDGVTEMEALIVYLQGLGLARGVQ